MRGKYNAYQYDVSSTFNLGKFFTKNYGVKLPMYLGRSETVKSPQYNPLDPDILLSKSLSSLNTKSEKDSLRDYYSRLC